MLRGSAFVLSDVYPVSCVRTCSALQVQMEANLAAYQPFLDENKGLFLSCLTLTFLIES